MCKELPVSTKTLYSFYVGYNLTNVFYSPMETFMGVWELALRKKVFQLHSLKCRRMHLCKHHLCSIRQLPSTLFHIDKKIARYQIIMIKSYRRAKAGKIVDLGVLPPCHLLALWLLFKKANIQSRQFDVRSSAFLNMISLCVPSILVFVIDNF